MAASSNTASTSMTSSGIASPADDIATATSRTLERVDSNHQFEDSKKSRKRAHSSFDDVKRWRKFRVLRPFRGITDDICRWLPYYWSDITDAFTYRTAASTVRMYFFNILPALAYTLGMNRRTDGFYGVNESLFSSALAAMVFSTISAQPLTIVGITGLISLFNYTIFDIIKIYHVTIYARFMCWTAIWAATWHWLVASWNLCDYMRYVTGFSSETFDKYVGIIYMIKGAEELVALFDYYGSVDGYLSCVIAILYFGTIYALQVFHVT